MVRLAASGRLPTNGVEIFTLMVLEPGPVGTLHLFSRYAKAIRVESVSSLDTTVSAYSSVNAAGDSCTVILVNRHPTTVQSSACCAGRISRRSAGSFDVLELSSLPTGQETFISAHKQCAQEKTVTPASSAFSLDLPAYSVSAVLLAGKSEPV